MVDSEAYIVGWREGDERQIGFGGYVNLDRTVVIYFCFSDPMDRGWAVLV